MPVVSIGRHVVQALCDKGADVWAVDFHTEGIDSRANLLNTAIFSGDEDIFQQLGNPDACLHMAWRDGFVHNSDAHMVDLSKHYTFIRNHGKRRFAADSRYGHHARGRLLGGSD